MIPKANPRAHTRSPPVSNVCPLIPRKLTDVKFGSTRFISPCGCPSAAHAWLAAVTSTLTQPTKDDALLFVVAVLVSLRGNLRNPVPAGGQMPLRGWILSPRPLAAATTAALWRLCG